MDKKRILKITALALVIILVLGCMVFILFSANPPASTTSRSSQYAYRACHRTMMNTAGYGVWALQNAKYQQYKAQFDFDDGFNTATCEAMGLGPFWIGTKTLETAVGCVQSLAAGTECPRKKFGVTP